MGYLCPFLVFVKYMLAFLCNNTYRTLTIEYSRFPLLAVNRVKLAPTEAAVTLRG